MKKISIIASALSICFAGCLKDTPPTDFGTLKPIVELFYYDAGQTAHGGLENFSKDAILTAGASGMITVNFNANLASVDPLTQDLTVTLGVDDAKRTAYNSANTNQYVALPSTAYTFTTKTATIKAGSRLANFSISFDPSKIDPSQNLMLPISITDAQGQAISGNFGTIYFHMIGNPLAGVYTSLFNRWNNGTGTGTATTITAGSLIGLPVDATTVEFQSGYGAQNGIPIRYRLTFTNTAGVLSNFAVRINPDDVTNSVNGAIGALSFTDASIILADGVNKHFKFTFNLVNSAAAGRFFTDEYTH